MRRRLALVFLGLLLPAAPLLAGGPALHQVAGSDALAKGTLEGLSLDEQGVLRPGPGFDALALDASNAWAAISTEGALWIGTGNEARLLRVAPDGKVQRIQTGDGLMVTALAALPGGAVAAAVFPGARIVRVTAAGEVETHARLPAEHVWALVVGEDGHLVAATGSPGALFSIDPFGAVERLVEIGDDHARALARRGDELLVGTAPKGLLLSVRGTATTVLRDLEPQEVVGIVPSEAGLYVAANQDQTGGNVQAIGNLLKQVVEPPEPRAGKEPAARASLQDGRLYLLEPSGLLTSLWEAKQVALLSLAADGRGAVAGTYPSGRLVRVEAGAPSSILADLPEAEASVVLAEEGRLLAVATSNPAVLHRRASAPAAARYTSAPIDGGATARWGRVTVSGHGVRGLETRAGETSEPDATWGPWTAAEGFDGVSGAAGRTARFLQVRLTLEGADAWVRDLAAVAQAPNRAPLLSDVQLKKPGDADRPNAVREVTWKPSDPDGDRLETALFAQRDGSSLWVEVAPAKVLDKPTVSWDTAGLPDGTWRLRLEVSDRPDNEADRVRSATHVLGPVRVDNTPPAVRVAAKASGGRLVIEGEAADQPGGRIQRVRVSVDGGPWLVAGAHDGLYDSSTERFALSLPLPPSGLPEVVVQAVDSEQNVGAAAAAR
jgi:hypothetical protein